VEVWVLVDSYHFSMYSIKMNMNKFFLLTFLSVFIFPAFLHARGSAEDRVQPLTVYAIRGPSGVGLIRLFEEPPQIPGFDVRMEALASPDLIAARFISGEARAGILPPNVAANIRALGRNIQVIAIIGTGMLSLLTSDPDVQGLEDLRGKTVEVAGQAATPDFVFRTILAAHGIEPDRDVHLGFSLAVPEITLSLVSGSVSTALLPEPFATMARTARPDLRDVADVQEEWIRAGGPGNYPMTLLVVDGDFAAANPAAVTEILNAARNSIEWVQANPAEAGELVEEHDLGLRAPVITAAIPHSNYVFIPAVEGRAAMEALFRVFLENTPVSIGGVLPDDGFYWAKGD